MHSKINFDSMQTFWLSFKENEKFFVFYFVKNWKKPSEIQSFDAEYKH